MALGNALIAEGVFCHVANEHDFEDKYLLYRFIRDASELENSFDSVDSESEVAASFSPSLTRKFTLRKGLESFRRRKNSTVSPLDALRTPELKQGTMKEILEFLVSGKPATSISLVAFLTLFV